eukprot:Tbor_TRINITY_DN4998_c0_g1::TRINITY_DN4998_c0_g1_i1::g.10001::m.10001/K15287/SLC35F1_2; solute carrier family 35, member F1/2
MEIKCDNGEHIDMPHVLSPPATKPIDTFISFVKSPKFRQFLGWFGIIVLGQFMSFNVATSGVFITYLVRTNSSLPMLQAVAAYTTISIVFGFVYFFAVIRKRKEINAAYKIEYYDDEHNGNSEQQSSMEVVGGPSYDSCAANPGSELCPNNNEVIESSIRIAKIIKWAIPSVYYYFMNSQSLSPYFFSSKKRNNGKTFRGVCKGLWRYAFIALLDMQATYCIVSAYNYTDMTSIQILDCSTVIFCIIISYLFLKGVNYHIFWHITGAAIALGGIIFLVVIDIEDKARSGGDDGPVRTRRDIIIGDFLTILACLFYAMSNVATEKLVSSECGEEGDAKKAAVLKSSEDQLDTVVLLSQPIPAASPTPQTWIPPLRVVVIIEYLFWMPLSGAIFSTVQFLALEEYKQIAYYTDTATAFQAVANGTSYGELGWLAAFCICMLIMYTGFPCLFLLAGATFVNLSLLTADGFSIIWNAVLFDLKPNDIFFVPLIMILIGLIIFDTDGFKSIRVWYSKRLHNKSNEPTVVE